MQHSEASKVVREFIGGSSALLAVTRILDATGIKGFLGGGTLRNLLSGGDAAADLDLYVECSPDILSSSIIPALEAAGVEPGSLDITPTGNAVEFTRQNDFTVNSLLYELQAGTLLDHFGALADLEAKVLRHNSAVFFISSPRAFIRVFRLSAELNFAIEPETAVLVERYAQIVQCAPREGRVKMIGDLIKYLNVGDISASLPLFFRSRVFESLFPELLPLENVRNAAGRAYTERNRASLATLQGALQTEASKFTPIYKRYEQLLRSGGTSYRAQVTGLAILRLALLTQHIERCYLSLDPALPTLFKEPEFVLRTRKRIFSTMVRDLPANSALTAGILSAISVTGESGEVLDWIPDPALRTALSDLYSISSYPFSE